MNEYESNGEIFEEVLLKLEDNDFYLNHVIKIDDFAYQEWEMFSYFLNQNQWSHTSWQLYRIE